jgi:5-(carboxyamino)imidazole ribonucleotide synthase
MLNILGDVWFGGERMREPDWSSVLAVPGAKLHLYGKSEARRGRKMGHVTCVAATLAEALGRAAEVARVLGITPPH